MCSSDLFGVTRTPEDAPSTPEDAPVVFCSTFRVDKSAEVRFAQTYPQLVMSPHNRQAPEGERAPNLLRTLPVDLQNQVMAFVQRLQIGRAHV